MTTLHWIETEHSNAAHRRVLETCLWSPEEIADDSQRWADFSQSLLRIFASGKPRLEIGDDLYAAIDNYLHERIEAEEQTVLDEEREDAYRRLQAERGW